MSNIAELFNKQLANQSKLLELGTYDKVAGEDTVEKIKEAGIPYDSPRICSYHVQQLISEIGEVLEADKRWKNFRNERFDRAEKLDEIADCIIVILNVTIFSGYSDDELYNAVKHKLDVVLDRINKIKE